MSGTTKSGAATSAPRFWVTVKADTKDTYILLHEHMRKSIASPCGIRLIDIGECEYKDERFRSLCFLEARRKGEGAIGSFCKDGFVRYIAGKTAYTSFISNFDALARLGSDFPSSQQHHDNSAENAQAEGVIVRKEVLHYFRKNWENGRGYRGARYIWIDRLCILQNEEDLRWHDVDLQVDIHNQAVQCVVSQDGLPNALLNARREAQHLPPIIRSYSSSSSQQRADRHFPLPLCSHSGRRAVTLRDVLHPFLSNASGHKHHATPALDSIQEIINSIDRVTNKPKKFEYLAKAQAAWESLFTKTYTSHNEFIKACRKEFTLETPNEERATDWDLVMLSSQLSKMVDIPVFWLGVVIDVPPDPIIPLFPSIRHASSRSTDSAMANSLFVRDPDLQTEFYAQTPSCTLILRNAAVRGLIPNPRRSDALACGPTSLQLPWDPLHDWAIEDVHSGCTKTWLVYLGSMNRCLGGISHKDPIIDVLPFSPGTEASKTAHSSSSRVVSSAQAATKFLAPPNALRYHFLVLEEDVTEMELPEYEDEGRPTREPKKVCQLKGWLGKDVAEWLKPTGWSRRHTFSIVVRPEVTGSSRQHTSNDVPQPEVDDLFTYHPEPGVSPPPTYEETQALDRALQTPEDSSARQGSVLGGVAPLPLAQPRPVIATRPAWVFSDRTTSASAGRTPPGTQRGPSTEPDEDDEETVAGTTPSSRAPSPAETDITLVGDVDDHLRPPVSPCMSQSSISREPASSLEPLSRLETRAPTSGTREPGRGPLSRASDFHRQLRHG
ncbi:uncharacterized protein TRAVEDRAFT_24540 [Trametes versicolor FP-101664 SS1]|uniref:uncharacterized protein n=1 Tax=Trametes versicolor (strain FP-101664) TaxID=717944 RepID=UPI000462140B|nr:uncharacterized protein TRAVEDRAFT_24540 [Trametes versicolor FP-101664 SS1]EIW52308.1 hypothetical protein TRAVEDRAFT_24540 [Trametes versicolor FP-101664 SS1]